MHNEFCIDSKRIFEDCCIGEDRETHNYTSVSFWKALSLRVNIFDCISKPFSSSHMPTLVEREYYTELKNFLIEREYTELKREIDKLLALPDDWDGEDGRAPSRKTVDSAILTLSLLKKNKINPPELSVAGDNEIGFEWRGARGFAYTFFRGASSLVLVAKIDDEKVYDPAIPIVPQLSQDLIETISKVG